MAARKELKHKQVPVCPDRMDGRLGEGKEQKAHGPATILGGALGTPSTTLESLQGRFALTMPPPHQGFWSSQSDRLRSRADFWVLDFAG